MRACKIITLCATATACAMFLSAAPVSALPLSPAAGGTELVSQLVGASPLSEIRSRRGRGGAGAGFAAGLLLGGIIASQPGYYYRGYPPYPYYSPAYPAYGPYYPGDSAIAYCMSRFRSYDPYTGTYLGYDGYRHPCP